ncbi:MAG: hypothetical protein WAN35_00080 [Terracidiphilus sp.]
MDRNADREQIERILRSHTFADKSQLKRLLEVLFKYIDSETALKPAQVITELWPEEIKTKRSTDVATEMARLRKALDLYYHIEGPNDPIRISLPNRSMPGPDGMKEKRWIVAEPSGVVENAAPSFSLSDSPAVSLKTMKIIGAILAFILVSLIALRIWSADSQPHFGRLDGSTLTIMNAEGDELWHKNYADGFRRDYYEQGLATRIWFGDLDGNGHSEILFLYQPAANPNAHSTTLICYSSKGKEMWRWTPGRVLAEIDSPAFYETVGMGVLKAASGQPRRIVLSSRHTLYYPHQIALVNSNGKTLSEYWHSGHLDHMVLASLDDGGHEQVIAGGISNGYHQATLVVLDPDRMNGASNEPERPDLQLHGMGIAKEKMRLLFTRSDLNRTLSVYNIGQDVIVDGGLIRFSVLECELLARCVIEYEFDKEFNLHTAIADDQFRGAHKQFYLTNKTHHEFSSIEEAEFRKIRCLSGCASEYLPVQIP